MVFQFFLIHCVTRIRDHLNNASVTNLCQNISLIENIVHKFKLLNSRKKVGDCRTNYQKFTNACEKMEDEFCKYVRIRHKKESVALVQQFKSN